MLFTWTKEKPEKILNISRTAEVDEEGNWTTVISAAVFIL
jgi:arginine decarboxylase